jgi:hypothetical protein
MVRFQLKLVGCELAEREASATLDKEALMLIDSE